MRRSMTLLLCMMVVIGYLLILYYMIITSKSGSAQMQTDALRSHFALIALAVAVTFFAWLKHHRGLLMLSMTLYASSLIFLPSHWILVSLPTILTFSTFLRMGNEPSADEVTVVPPRMNLWTRLDKMWSNIFDRQYDYLDDPSEVQHDATPDILLFLAVALAFIILFIAGAVIIRRIIG